MSWLRRHRFEANCSFKIKVPRVFSNLSSQKRFKGDKRAVESLELSKCVSVLL